MIYCDTMQKIKTIPIPVDLHADLKEISKHSGIKLRYLTETFLRSGVTTYVTSGKLVKTIKRKVAK